MGILKVLFVCARNMRRGPTAENIYQSDLRLQVKSAGLLSSSKHSLNKSDLSWADVVFVMEDEHKKQISDTYRDMNLPKIVSLNIPDDYEYMDDELVERIKSGTDPVLLELFEKSL